MPYKSWYRYILHFTWHVDSLAAALADDVLGFTIGQTLRLHVILCRLAVSVRARYSYLLYPSITLQYYCIKHNYTSDNIPFHLF